MSKLTNTTLSILTTAAAGAALMYLFDPEHGQDRRGRISDFASDKWSDLADKVSDLATTVGSSAAGLAGSGSDGVHHLHQHVGKLTNYVSELASNLSSKLSDTADDARDYANDTRDSWYGSAANLASRARKYARGYQPERHGYGTAAAVGAGGVGMLLLGAGLMYFLDPDHGRRRRTAAVDTVNGAVGGLGELASKSGNYIRERASGAYDTAADYAGRVGGRMSSMASDLAGRTGAPDLVQKATDALTQASEAFRSVHVHLQDGKLVLDGTVPAAAYDRALSALEGIPGIPEVVNNLQVSEGTEH